MSDTHEEEERGTHEEDEEIGTNEEEEGIDANEEEEERDGNALVQVQQSEPSSRPQRKRTVTKWLEDKIVVTELSMSALPVEKRAQIRMRRLAGLIARQRISLNMPSFNTLSEEDKMDLFNECVQPRLEFPKEKKHIACKKMMQMVAKSWRTHKSELVRKFSSKGLEATAKHPYIKKEDWENFMKQRQ